MHYRTLPFCTILNGVNKTCSKSPSKVFYSKAAALKKDDWIGVVGLEVHAQINSVSKLFSGAATDYGAPINQNVAFFDAAIPGTLPVLNRRCVEAAVLTALALNCQLNPVSSFDRKHYFYADLPAGYQITQQRCPIAKKGELQFPVFNPNLHKKPFNKKVRIHQLQLEQDSGKSLHDSFLNRSLIDLNRAGAPLMELVFEPDLSCGEEAAALVKELSLILTSIKTCLCKMEEGGMRVDANISVHKKGMPLGVRTEVKNIGSVRGVARAVDYEIQRQRQILSQGGEVVNETRSWDAENNCTLPMRDKEMKQDYRFMPEPNLPPLHLDMEGSADHPYKVSVPRLQDSLPELPEAVRQRLQEQHSLNPVLALRLVNEPELLKMFEAILEENSVRNASSVANVLVMEVLTLVNKGLCSLGSSRPTSSDVGEVIDLLQLKKINLVTARLILEEIAGDNSTLVQEVVTSRNLWLVTDEEEIRKICHEAMERNVAAVKAFRQGKTKALAAILGDIAKTTNNSVDMSLAAKQLQEMLKQS